MSEQSPSSNELWTALRELSNQLLKKSQEADKQSRQLSFSNVQQAAYQRGLAEGLRIALADLKQIIESDEPTPEQDVDESYSYVTREAALALLGQAGIHISELHQHEDNTFSAILPPLQVFAFEERLEKLGGSADIIILAKGKLPNSNKAYVDFAFSMPYSP